MPEDRGCAASLGLKQLAVTQSVGNARRQELALQVDASPQHTAGSKVASRSLQPCFK